jgi:hypothetical protein
MRACTTEQEASQIRREALALRDAAAESERRVDRLYTELTQCTGEKRAHRARTHRTHTPEGAYRTRPCHRTGGEPPHMHTHDRAAGECTHQTPSDWAIGGRGTYAQRCSRGGSR